MKIAANAVVALDYTLKDDHGKVLDDSGGEPLHYLHGKGQLVPGLERALEGQVAGTSFNVVVEPKDGYGLKKHGKTVKVPREDLPEDEDMALEEGVPIEAVGPDGKTTVLWVLETSADEITLSLDHPLAGVTLHFDVTIREVRKATREELAHGHVHGPGDHHHH